VKGPGKVYLVGTSHDGVLREVFRRVHVEIPTPRVAITYAALPHPPRDGHQHAASIGRLFHPAATVERFSVDGEDDAMPASKARAIVENANVLFFGGGDPVLIAQRLVAAGADAWVREARARGAVSVGLSAGSIALCAFWASWPDDDPDAKATVLPCLRVVPDLVVDCHAEGDDWEELRVVRHQLGKDAHRLRFAGIGSGSALVVGSDESLEWIGKPFSL